jgi:hypothetical protein
LVRLQGSIDGGFRWPRLPRLLCVIPVLRAVLSRDMVWDVASFDIAGNEAQAMTTTELHFIFDAMPGPEGPRLIEVEDQNGHSIKAGEWRTRPDGLVELVVKRHEWQPIDTAPTNKWLLLWWVPKTDPKYRYPASYASSRSNNKYAECCVIGQVCWHDEMMNGEKPKTWWNGQRQEEQDLAHITNWSYLPGGPADENAPINFREEGEFGDGATMVVKS